MKVEAELAKLLREIEGSQPPWRRRILTGVEERLEARSLEQQLRQEVEAWHA